MSFVNECCVSSQQGVLPQLFLFFGQQHHEWKLQRSDWVWSSINGPHMTCTTLRECSHVRTLPTPSPRESIPCLADSLELLFIWDVGQMLSVSKQCSVSHFGQALDRCIGWNTPMFGCHWSCHSNVLQLLLIYRAVLFCLTAAFADPWCWVGEVCRNIKYSNQRWDIKLLTLTDCGCG